MRKCSTNGRNSRGSDLAGKGTMSPRAYVCSAVAAVAVLFFPASAGALVMQGVSVNAGATVNVGVPVQIVCTAMADGSFIKDVPTTATFSGDGAFSPVTTTFSGTSTSAPYTASTMWTPPATAGSFTVACQGFGSRYSSS